MDIGIIKEQFGDIVEHMSNDYQFELYAEDDMVMFKNVTINGIPYKDKVLFFRGSMSEVDFQNSVKAYLFDVLDGVANL